MKTHILPSLLLLAILASCAPAIVAPATETVPAATTTPTRTPRPTFTPFLTSTPFLTPETVVYDFPDWLREPGDHVLMMAIRSQFIQHWSGDHDELLFIDVERNAQYRLRLAYFDSARWLDSSHVLMFHKGDCFSFGYFTILDLPTGRVNRQVREDFPGDACPPDLPRHVAYGLLYPGPEILIGDTLEQTIESFFPQTDEFQNISAELSPDEKLLVILQGEASSREGYRFVFYDFSSRELLKTYKVSKADRNFWFAGQGQKLIFIEDYVPCELEIATLQKKCGVPISKKLSWIYFSGLSRDESRLLFSYDTVPDNKSYGGGICIYGIWTGEGICPMNQLDILHLDQGDEALTVWSEEFSGDEKYIAFVYGHSCRGCGDIQVEVGIGIVNLNGTLLFHQQDPDDTDFEWRPMPEENAE